MMKFRSLFLAALATGFLFACTAEDLLQEEILETPAGEYPASLYETGHVRIYVDTPTAERIEASGQAEALITTKAASVLGNVRMERTFPYAGKFEKRTREAGLDRWYDVWFDDSTPLTKAAVSLEDLPGVLEVEYRPVTRKAYDESVTYVTPAAGPAAAPAGFTFDDPEFSKQWDLYNDGAANGKAAGCDINVIPVWQDYTTGNPDVVVCVVDGGIDCEHEDLAANLWSDPNRPSIHGFNFIDGSANIIKSQHGTHVAGTIAAVNNNGKGICGIAGGDYAKGAPGVRLMSAQIFKDGEEGSGNGARAIKWGADNGAIISQNSWGYEEIDYVPNSDRMAIDYFNTYAGMDENGFQVGPMAGGLVVFSAGNENIEFGAPAYYEGAMAVGSIGADYYRAYYSCYGEWVDVAAPGGDYQKGYQILSTLPNNKYGLMQGTSMACPHISGVAALIVSKCGGIGFTRDMLWNRIVNTARDLNSYNRNFPVGGLVDVTAAILAEGSTPPEPVTDFQASLLNADFIRFSLTVPRDEDDNKAFGVNIYYSKEPFSETTMLPYKRFPVEDLQAGDKMEDVLSGLEFETTYYLACEAFDRIGNRSELSNLVVVTTGENHAPTITTDDPLNFTLKSHETRWLNFSYTDPDGHGVHAKLDSGSAADSLYQMQGLTQKIEVNALRAEPGTYTGLLHVFDDYEKETTLSYTYTIQSNHEPKVVGQIDDMVFGSKGEMQTVDLSKVFSDEDGETLIYTTLSSDNDILNLHVREGVLYVTALKYGYASATVNAADARGQSVSVNFKTLSRDGSKAIDVYPTTITDGNLYIRTATDQPVSVLLISETGTVVLEKSLTATPFSPAILDLSGLGSGPYSVKVTFGGETLVQNIVKL